MTCNAEPVDGWFWCDHQGSVCYGDDQACFTATVMAEAVYDCPGPHHAIHRASDGAPEIDRKELMHALWDGIADRFDPDMESPDEHWDWYHDNVEKPVAAILCHVYGHEPVQDHCGMPEHDHCVWCRTLMPGAAR